MSKVMTAIGAKDDSKYSTGTTGSGSVPVPVPNVPPVLTAGYSKIAANTYLFTAMATDADGSVVRYEFKNGTSLVSS